MKVPCIGTVVVISWYQNLFLESAFYKNVLDELSQTWKNPDEPRWTQTSPDEPRRTPTNPDEPRWTQMNPGEQRLTKTNLYKPPQKNLDKHGWLGRTKTNTVYPGWTQIPWMNAANRDEPRPTLSKPSEPWEPRILFWIPSKKISPATGFLWPPGKIWHLLLI